MRTVEVVSTAIGRTSFVNVRRRRAQLHSQVCAEAPLKRCGAFTLVELLVVIGIIVVLMSLLIPAMNAIKGSGDVTSRAYDMAGALENARAYAMGNSTYVWVGVLEENGANASPSTPVNSTSDPGGRVIVSVVASKDGTRYKDSSVDATNPPAFGADATPTSKNPVILVQLGKVMRLENTHIAAVNDGLPTKSTNYPVRPPVSSAYQVGDQSFGTHTNYTGTVVTNPTTFTYPLTTAATATQAQYTFSKIIEFSPQGEASKIVENVFSGPGVQSWLEIALQPTHAIVVDPVYSGANKNHAAAVVSVEGITGRAQIFRP